MADRTACSIGWPVRSGCPVWLAQPLECFATIFDISISMDDDSSTIEFLNKSFLIPTTIFNIQAFIIRSSGSSSIEFDCFSSFDSI
ncbi:hypothetical protein Hanom_Chr15g01385441 [Helianthus anomalus]